MCLALLFEFFGGAALAQIKPVPTINTNGGGTMLVVDGGGGGGGTPGCNVPNITTNISGSPYIYNVTVNGTAPQFTMSANGATFQWYMSTTGNVNDFTAIPNATGTSYTPDVSKAGTFYYVGNATNSCGSSGTPTAVVVVSPAVTSPVAGTISGGATVCSGNNSTTLTLSGYTGTIQWQSSTDNNTFADISNATGVSYTTANLNITTWYRVVVSSGGSTATSTSVAVNVNANASAGTVTAGTSPQCIGSSTTYTVSGVVLSGGTGAWSSDNTSVATVDASGNVKAIGPGNCNIIYTVTGATCGGTVTASQPYSVNPNASAGTVTAGTSPQCIGSSTTYTVSGVVLNGGTGAWSSDNTAVATVDASGNVKAIGPGNCNIIYTVTGATCGGTVTTSQPYSVNPNASAGTVTAGTSPQCIGSSTTYTVSGVVLNGGTGAWSSDNTSVATVDASGNVKAIGPGNCNIIYTVTGATCGGTVTASQPYSVNPNASAGTVTAGTSPQCIGSSTTYTVSGVVLNGGTGAWSSDNTAVATVDASSGNVKAIGPGTCNIIYTVTGGCGGTQTASQPYSVISSIDASANSNPIALGSSVALSATISPAISGVTVTFNVDPGTGIITTYTGVTNTSGIATTAPISGLSVNVYKVIATAAGCAISNAAYLPVYDPNSSFVTGGGWIISPVGALVAQPLLTGKANFGFVAKYQKGSSNVNGNTEFDFQDGNFNFVSSSLNPGTLVISGAKATYRGVGTVNGAGNYGFMVSAVDGQINGGGGTDLFRIKIWDMSKGNTVVYDNNMGTDENGVPTTALGGGSIVIHYAKTTSRLMNTSSNVDVVNRNQLIGTGPLTVKVMPNPSTNYFSLRMNSLSQQNLKITVTDILGRVIEEQTNVQANSTIQLGNNYQQGVYFVQFIQGTNIVTVRLIKE